MGFSPFKSNKTFEATATLNLVDPESGVELEHEGKPVSITMYGKAAKEHQKAVEALQKKIDKRGNRKVSMDELIKDNVNFLADISVSTDNLVDEEGKAIETHEQFVTLYSDKRVTWIRDQVSTFASDDVSFLPK